MRCGQPGQFVAVPPSPPPRLTNHWNIKINNMPLKQTSICMPVRDINVYAHNAAKENNRAYGTDIAY